MRPAAKRPYRKRRATPRSGFRLQSETHAGRFGPGSEKPGGAGTETPLEAESSPTLQVDPPCSGLPLDGGFTIKAPSPYKSALATWVPGGPAEGTPVDVKTKAGKCLALSALGVPDAFYLLAKSVLKNGKHQTQFEVRFVAHTLPIQNLKLRLVGLMGSLDGAAREIQVRFYDYDDKKWGAAHNKSVDSNVSFDKSFVISSDLFDHIKSPKGIVKCKITVRHLAASSKTNAFGLWLDKAALVIE